MPAGGLLTAGIIASGAQTALGIGQSISASRKKKKAMQAYKDNPYMIPESQIRATNIASKMAQGTDLPAQDLMEENLASGTAASVAGARRAATSPSQVLQSTVNSYLAQQQRQQELDTTAAQSYQARQAAYQNALVQLSPYEDAKYRNNVLFPIQAELNAASSQGSAGMSNIGQGIQSGLSMYANQQYLNKLNAPTMTPTQGASASPTLSQPSANYGSPWWGGGLPDTSIQQRQGTY